MVSQRQRLARKRYKEAHPEQFPKPEPTPPKDPDKKKKRRACSSVRNLFLQLIDPLEEAHLRGILSAFLICLQCRRRGHRLKNCPDKNDESIEKKLCYNCGDTSHSLSHCPYPVEDGRTKFASCFICKEHGHISKNCPQNKHGVYPMGGCCKVCGSVAHLIKDCPDKFNRDSAQPKSSRFDATPRGKVTKLSGDDLEDDFTEEPKSSKKIKTSDTTTPDDSDMNSIEVKHMKKKQGPEVVKFLG